MNFIPFDLDKNKKIFVAVCADAVLEGMIL
jgi:hypothetical protein